MKIALYILLVIQIYFVSACESTYHLRGKVIRLSSTDINSSFIAETTGQDVTGIGVPIPNATVAITTQTNIEEATYFSASWDKETVTDDKGYFKIYGVTAPYKVRNLGLWVGADGYKSAFGYHRDYYDLSPQEFLIILKPINP